MNITPIREYEQAVYIYWLGPNLPTVKIGHSNDPERRLEQFRREAGTPNHKAEFAAIVWLDRGRERVERAAHVSAAAFRPNPRSEWFSLSAAEALNYVVAAAEFLGIRYEVEDRAGVWAETLARREAERRAELIRRIGDNVTLDVNACDVLIPDPEWKPAGIRTTAHYQGYMPMPGGPFFDRESAKRAMDAYNAPANRKNRVRTKHAGEFAVISNDEGGGHYPSQLTITQAWLNSEDAQLRVTTDTLETWLFWIERDRKRQAEVERQAMLERARQIEANRAAAHAEYLATTAARAAQAAAAAWEAAAPQRAAERAALAAAAAAREAKEKKVMAAILGTVTVAALLAVCII